MRKFLKSSSLNHQKEYFDFFFNRLQFFFWLRKRKNKKLKNFKLKPHLKFIFINNSNYQEYTSIIMKKGLFFRYLDNNSLAFNLFFFFFKKKNSLFLEFSSFFKWIQFSTFYYSFFSPQFILMWLTKQLGPRFNIQCITVPKKYKRKFKCKYLFRLKYVHFGFEHKKALKWLYLYTNNFNQSKLYQRIFFSLSHSFFEENNSFLYQKKISIYKKILIKSRLKNQ